VNSDSLERLMPENGKHFPCFFRAMSRVVSVLVFFVPFLLLSPCFAQKSSPDVLILNSYHPGYAWTDDELAGLLKKLAEEYPDSPPSIEYLDTKRFPSTDQLILAKNYLAGKYRDRKFDLVIALDNPALSMALNYGEELFPGVPVVFAGINNFMPEMLSGHRNVTGVVENVNIAGTLETALALHPNCKQVFVVNDYTPTGMALRHEMDKILPRFRERITFKFLPPATIEEMLEQLRSVPSDALVLMLSFVTDRKERILPAAKGTRLICSATAAPVYANHEAFLGYGVVGGILLAGKGQGQKAGDIALRILGGEDPAGIPVALESTARPMFDYVQLAKFNIPLGALPRGSTVINRPASFYEDNKPVVWAGFSVLAVLSIVIVVLSWAIVQRRRAYELARRSEARLGAIVNNAQDCIYIKDSSLRYTLVNPALCSLLGMGQQEILGRTDMDLFDAGSAMELRRLDDRVLDGDVADTLPTVAIRGEKRYLHTIKVPLMDAEGQIAGLCCIARDITDWKQMETRLRQSHRDWEQIFRAIGHPTLILDREHNILQANQRVLQLTGKSAEELLGKKCFDIFHEAKTASHKCPLESLLVDGRAGPVEREIDALEGVFLVSCTPVLDDEARIQKIIHIATDITERKRAEEALRRSEGEKSAILNGLTTIFVRYIDLEMRIIWANVASGEAIGRPVEELKGKRCHEVIRGLDHPCEGCSAVKAMITGRVEEGELETPDGRTFLLRSSPVMHDGVVTGVVHVTIDISESKRSLEQLLKLNRELHAIIECNHALIRAADEQTLLADVCRIICDVGGYRMAWVGTVMHDEEKSVRPVAWAGAETGYLEDAGLITWADTEGGQGPTAFAVRTGKTSYFQDLTNDPRFALWRENALSRGFRSNISIPLSDAERVFATLTIYSSEPNAFTEDEIRMLEDLAAHLAFGIVSLRNRAERKQTERAIQAMVESTVGGFDTDFFDSAVSRVAEWLDCEYAFIGEIRDDGFMDVIAMKLDGSFMHDRPFKLEGTPFADPGDVEYSVIPENVRGLFPKVRELVGMDAEGCVVVPIRDKNTNVIGFLCAISRQPLKLPESSGDVLKILAARISAEIARRRMEQEKESIESHLRRAQKLEAIGTLAGGIAHDFNNILTPIIGYTEIAMGKPGGSSSLQYSLEQVLSAANRARELVKQILSFSRMGEDQLLRPIDLSSICKEALELLRASLPSTIEIRQKLERGSVLADPTQIHQVIVNLCTNAADAMGNRGILDVSLVQVNLGPEDLRAFSNPALSPGPYLKLSVADTGQGMDAATMQRIFEPYFTTKETGKGTGLGLATAHGIIRRHGGEITVRSEPSRGSVFDVYLPMAVLVPRDTLVAPEPVPGGSEHILLVDDEPMIAEIGATILKQLGYCVTALTDSREALRVFSSSPRDFDLVLTDYTMPGLTGVELAGEISGIRSDIPIILTTGLDATATEQAAEAVGIRKLATKPWNRVQLAKLVRSVLDDRE